MSLHNEFLLSLDNFEVLPDTPASLNAKPVNFEDFTEASPLNETFCKQLTLNEYEDQSSNFTEKSLQELAALLERNPSLFMKIMQKRKLEEMEQTGMMSFLKVKFLTKFHGEKFRRNLITSEECETRVSDVKEGMMQAFQYSEECKGRKRYNTRLAAKRKAAANLDKDQSSPFKKPSVVPEEHNGPNVQPPPVPPCPPPPLLTPVKKPLSDQTNNMLFSPNLERPPLRKPVIRVDSTRSVASLHEELLSSNPLKRLKATKTVRSPGGTPKSKRQRRSNESVRFETPARVNTPGSETLTSLLIRMMDQKFKHVRSPSPACASPRSSTASPQPGFTP